jgi:hypothetical protein
MKALILVFLRPFRAGSFAWKKNKKTPARAHGRIGAGVRGRLVPAADAANTPDSSAQSPEGSLFRQPTPANTPDSSAQASEGSLFRQLRPTNTTRRFGAGVGGRVVLPAASKKRDLFGAVRPRARRCLSAKHGFAPPSGCTWMYTLGLRGAGTAQRNGTQGDHAEGVGDGEHGAGRRYPIPGRREPQLVTSLALTKFHER